MEHNEDLEFWDAALKDFPRFPHLTKFRLIYHYFMPNSYNIFRRTDLPDRDEHCEPAMSHPFPSFDVSCWICFNSIISKRDIFPHLEVVDICPTYRLRLMDSLRLARLFRALKNPPDGRLTLWGNEVRFLLFPGIILVLIVISPKSIAGEIQPKSLKCLVVDS